jgi:hypothetical protein
MKALLLKLKPIKRITDALKSGQLLSQVLAEHGTFGD